jgi:hypothetical protein
LTLGGVGGAGVSTGGGATGSGKVAAGKVFSMAGAGAGSRVSGAGAEALGGLSDLGGLAGTASGLSAVSNRAVAPELAEGGATTFATCVCLAVVTEGKGLSSIGAVGGGADKRRCATGAGKGASLPMSEVERVCKPSKCSTNTNTTKPQTQGLVKSDAG